MVLQQRINSLIENQAKSSPRFIPDLTAGNFAGLYLMKGRKVLHNFKICLQLHEALTGISIVQKFLALMAFLFIQQAQRLGTEERSKL